MKAFTREDSCREFGKKKAIFIIKDDGTLNGGRAIVVLPTGTFDYAIRTIAAVLGVTEIDIGHK